MRKSARLPLEELEPFLLATPDPPAPIDWATVFHNDHPVELEVGCGKGLFLLNASLACPDVNFVGVEIVRKYALFTATRIAKRGLRNVRMVCADAGRFLTGCVATASLRAVHVYFPDPWWKKRHHKRRVFTAAFAAQCARVLRPGGHLHVATDVAEYFAVMGEVLAQQKGLSPLPPPEMKGPEHPMDYLTNFERKARLQGQPVYRALYERALTSE